MAGPWENYAEQPTSQDSGPWTKYAPPESPKAAPEEGLGSKVAGGMREAVGSIAEPLMAMGSGMAGKVAGDVAGLGAIPMHAMGLSGEPQDVQKRIQSGMTYQPRTQAGASPYNPLNAIPQGVGKLMEMLAGGAQRMTAPPGSSGPVQSAIGSGVGEAYRQLPALLGMKAPAAADAAATGLKSGAREVMQSALKPSEKAQKTGKAASAVDTLLDTGTNVTRGGVDKMRERIDVLNDKIADVIKNSPATIDKNAATVEMQKLVNKFQKRANYSDSIAAVQKSWDEFINHPLLSDQTPIQVAQEMKQATTKGLGDSAYGANVQHPASIDAQKTWARVLKEQIAKAAPEVAPLNAEESKLLNALSLTEKRVLMSANKNPMGLAWFSANPVKMAGFLADRSELFKSLVARMLNTGSKAMGPVGAAGPALGGIVANQPPTGSPVQQAQ
jgi:hypothetical protein